MKINAELLACAALYQAVEDVKFYLTGVNLAPGKDGKGVEIVATNGCVIFAGFDEGAKFTENRSFTVIIPKTVITQLKKHSTVEITIMPNNKCSFLMAETPYNLEARATHKLEIIREKFPEWRRIIPSYVVKKSFATETAPAYIQPEYFELIGLTGKILCPNFGSMALITTGENNAAVVRYSSEFGQALSMVMPIRSDPFEDLTFI